MQYLEDSMSECDNVGRFWDGELTQERARNFQDHLAGCVGCRRELDELADLDVLGQRAIGLTARPAPWWRRLLDLLF